LWFTTKFMIIRNTTVDQLGTYSMVIAVISVCSIIASLGVHDGATKYISQFIGEGKLFEAQSVRKTAIQIGLISGFAACALLFLFAGPLSRYIFYKPALETPLKVGSFFIPFNILTIILVWILRGYGFVKAKVYYLEVGMPLFFLAFLSIFLHLGFPFIGMLYAYTFSSV